MTPPAREEITPAPQQTDTGYPQIVADSSAFMDGVASDSVSGAVWNLDVPDRDLDSNIIALPPHGSIQFHHGPQLGVLIHVIAGSGELTTEREVLKLSPGVVVWLPQGSARQFNAGDQGLRYLTVHQHKRGLQIGQRPDNPPTGTPPEAAPPEGPQDPA